MISLNYFTGFADGLSVMVLCAFGVFLAFEIAKKTIKKMPGLLKDLFFWIVLGVSFVVYTILAFAKGFINPILTGLVNAILFSLIETCSWAIIKGIKKLVEYVQDLVKRIFV